MNDIKIFKLYSSYSNMAEGVGSVVDSENSSFQNQITCRLPSLTCDFENLYGYLRKYAHGTSNILPQLVESFMMHQALNSAATPKENNEETISHLSSIWTKVANQTL